MNRRVYRSLAQKVLWTEVSRQSDVEGNPRTIEMTDQRTTTNKNNDMSMRIENDRIVRRAPKERPVGSVSPRLSIFKTSKADEKSKTKLVTAIFSNRLAAKTAVDALIMQGYPQRDISLLMTDKTRTKEFGVESSSRVGQGAGVGAVVGGTIVAGIAAIAAVGSTLAIPGLGIIVAGPIAAAVAGAGAGGAAGTLVGALVGAGIPEHRAKVYDTGLREGGILLGVEARSGDEASAVEDLLQGRGGEQIKQE